jgi:tocopherol O-methyltransferase
MIYPRVLPTSHDVADHYDELDWVYRQIWGDHVHHGYWPGGKETPPQATEALIDLVVSRLDLEAGQKLCDIGCGYGATAALLAATRAIAVTGFTLSAMQFAIASERPNPDGRLGFHRRDWLANDIADHSFDRAYAIESSEHMADKQRFFDEAFRVLKPGGRLVICAWLARTGAGGWEVDYLLEPICREGRLPSMGTCEDYEALAANAGFVLLGFEDISRKVRRTWSICARRLIVKLASDPAYLRFVASKRTRNRIFILSLPRLILAYRLGAMRYGVFTLQRPPIA